MKYSKDLRPLVKAAKQAGWTIETAPGRLNQHVRFLSPRGARVTCASTPSDKAREFRQVRQALRRAGLNL